MIDPPNFRPRDDSLSLGRFAQAAGLTRKALRLYEQQGILLPRQVDPASGYRYYGLEQLEKARLIRLLREMELPLAEIRQILDCQDNAEAIRLVRSWENSFLSRARRVGDISKKVIAYLGEEEEEMDLKVNQRSIPEMRVVCLKQAITVPAFHQFIPEALQRLARFVREQGGHLAGDPLCFYYGPVNQQDDGPVEICFPCSGSVEARDDIQVKLIPAHQAAVARASLQQSRFPEILEVWDGLMTWVRLNRVKFSDRTVPCYEIWHEDETISVIQPLEA